MIIRDNGDYKYKPILNDIYKLYKMLNEFEYGYKIHNKNVVDNDEFNNYKTIDPYIFRKDKCGVCWDYVEYEALRFELLGFKPTVKIPEHMQYSLYYMQHETIDNCNPTHTWLGFNINGKFYNFESSWKKNNGYKTI